MTVMIFSIQEDDVGAAIGKASASAQRQYFWRTVGLAYNLHGGESKWSTPDWRHENALVVYFTYSLLSNMVCR